MTEDWICNGTRHKIITKILEKLSPSDITLSQITMIEESIYRASRSQNDYIYKWSIAFNRLYYKAKHQQQNYQEQQVEEQRHALPESEIEQQSKTLDAASASQNTATQDNHGAQFKSMDGAPVPNPNQMPNLEYWQTKHFRQNVISTLQEWLPTNDTNPSIIAALENQICQCRTKDEYLNEVANLFLQYKDLSQCMLQMQPKSDSTPNGEIGQQTKIQLNFVGAPHQMGSMPNPIPIIVPKNKIIGVKAVHRSASGAVSKSSQMQSGLIHVHQILPMQDTD